MDEVFLAEQEHLNGLIDNIQDKITQLSNSLPYNGVSRYSIACDIEDREALMFQKERNLDQLNSIRDLNNIIKEPYFARMDYIINESGNTCMYIGNKYISIGKYKIYDWRSPVGQTYYQKNILSFSINSTKYDLILRRMLEVKDSTLLSYYDEYVLGDDLSKNKITDPFLIRVFKSKKKEFRITNIIRSIQQNQNIIITTPLKSSFIVQGCAGSGKTMILLHRLSYLKYNNPDINLSNFVIITPSTDFNIFINELAVELELDQIDRMTKEEYYHYCLLQYDSKWKDIKFKDTNFPNAFIKELYSAEMYCELESIYYKYINLFLSSLALPYLNDICKQHDYEIFNMSVVSDMRKLDSISSFVTNLITLNNLTSKKYEQVSLNIKEKQIKLTEEGKKVNIESLRSELSKSMDFIDVSLCSILDQRSLLVNEVKNFLSKKGLCEYTQDDENYTVVLRKVQKAAIVLNTQYEEEISRNNTYLQQLENESSSLSEIIKNVTKVSEDKIKKYENQIIDLQNNGNSSFFTRLFRKRETLQKIEKLKDMIAEEKINLNGRIDLLEYELAEKQNKKNEMIELINDYRSKILLQPDLSYLDRCYNELCDLHCYILEANANKDKCIKSFSQRTLNYSAIEKEIEELIKKADTMQQKIISSNDMVFLLDIKEKLSNQNITTIFQNTFELLVHPLETKYRIINRPSNYYNAYLWLHFYSLFCGTLIHCKKYINIDEGQDLSPNEYRIIKKINGSDSIFNIYGDINQNIFSNGTTGWNDITFIEKIYELNENYRNTIEITSFCNKIFSYNHLPIGISGKNVRFIRPSLAIQEISDILQESRSERYAIIASDLNHPFVEHLIKSGCSLLLNSKDSIPVVTVPSIKGLEYDIVYVINDGLTDNEKYIAYTRALSELVIIESNMEKEDL